MSDVTSNSASPRVYIVENQFIAALDIRKQLEALGYRVLGIERTGEQAVSELKTVSPDLVLMALHLGGEIDGCETAGIVHDKYGIPVILMDDKQGGAQFPQILQADPYGYLEKPFANHELKIAIEIALLRYNAQKNIRQQKRLETVGRMAGGIAHDINNILTVIHGYLAILSDKVIDIDPSIEAEINGIANASGRASNLVRELLAFGRRLELRLSLTDLNKVITDTLDGMEGGGEKADETQISIELALTARKPLVLVDDAGIAQIISSLVHNARTAMPDGGVLSIRTANVQIAEPFETDSGEILPGLYITFHVEDEGVGISADAMSQIYEPFYTTKPGGEGHGLGLSTVYGIVTQSSGHIITKSEHGNGTEVIMYFPVAAADEDPEETELEDGLAGEETILIVDDNDDLRQLATEILGRKGYTTLSAGNAAEAILVAEQHGDSIDLLLTDIFMPRMDGATLSSRIRKIVSVVKVLYMSAYPDSYIKEQGMLDEEDNFIAKPFTVAGLLGAVRSSLG